MLMNVETGVDTSYMIQRLRKYYIFFRKYTYAQALLYKVTKVQRYRDEANENSKINVIIILLNSKRHVFGASAKMGQVKVSQISNTFEINKLICHL